jgi:hypothetical protein
MTVRIQKPAFNIREKLSELERPIGLKGSELMRAETAQEARDFVSAGRKNMVINGDMRIWQRENGGTVPASDVIYIDRFSCRDNTDGILTISRQASSAAGPLGESFRYVMKLDCDGADTSLLPNQYARIQHYVEGYNLNMDWGISNTDFITLSFWVKSNKPGIYCCGIEDGDVARIYIKEYTINFSDVWQKVELTYPPPPAGTWKNFDNSTGLKITWNLGTGTTYQGSANSWGTTYVMATSRQTNFMDNANNAFYLTGVQLEVGKNATEFEHRSYGEELALCQRYYYQTPFHYHFLHKNGYFESQMFYFPTTMRADPDVTTPLPVIRRIDSGSSIGFSGFTITKFTDGFYVQSTTTNDNLFYTFTFYGVITASAEL